MDDNTYTWLKELGAVRPMAPVGDEILALGKFYKGFYPITWNREKKTKIENWYVFGFLTVDPLTREDCQRIIEACDL